LIWLHSVLVRSSFFLFSTMLDIVSCGIFFICFSSDSHSCQKYNTGSFLYPVLRGRGRIKIMRLSKSVFHLPQRTSTDRVQCRYK
jgi:hypothetical protein